MRVLNSQPSPALAPWVKRLTIVESDGGATRALIPESGLILGIRYRGAAIDLAAPEGPLPEASLVGLRHRARKMQTLPGSGIVLVTFREGKAGAFFREPLHELYGATIALADVMPARDVELARERVAGATNDAARCAAVEQLLIARLGARPADRVVEAAVGAIVESKGSVRAGALALASGLSRDRFEKRFREAVGTAPKRLAAIVRLRHAMSSYRPGVSLADVAAQAGYFDQAHFTRDFRAFSGSAPKRFFESTDYC